MIAGMMVTYANMPATLSVMPPVVLCAVPAAGAAERPHAGQVVVPSGICVPHALQKAMGSLLGTRIHARYRPRDERPACTGMSRASYQNHRCKANGIREP